MFLGYNMTSESRDSTANSSLTYHRIIEAFKFGFSWRARLGDPAFNSDMNEVSKNEWVAYDIEQSLDTL